MYIMMNFPNPKKLILVVSDMAKKCIALLKYVMQHIKTVRIMRQSRGNVQHDEVPSPKS